MIGIIGTKDYRKPEWVTHMEELSAALKGNTKSGRSLSHDLSYDLSADSLETIHKQEYQNKVRSRHEISKNLTAKEPFYLTKPSVEASITQATSHHLVQSEPILTRTKSSDFISVAMSDYLNSHRHSLSSVMELINSPSFTDRQENRYKHFEEYFRYDEATSNKEEETQTDLFNILSPIEEKSEPSTRSSSLKGSNGSEKRKYAYDALGKHSSSCNVIPSEPVDMKTMPEKYLTFPRVKNESYLKDDDDYEISDNSPMFPLEPREIDPSAFFQLHTADSQEELQEFLLLESECMGDNDKGCGLASAFIPNDDSTYDSNCSKGKLTPNLCFFFTNFVMCVFLHFV